MMSMTKRDFELIAFAIRLEREPSEPWDRLVDRLAEEFGRKYPQFNKDKFLHVCQYSPLLPLLLEKKWK